MIYFIYVCVHNFRALRGLKRTLVLLELPHGDAEKQAQVSDRAVPLSRLCPHCQLNYN